MTLAWFSAVTESNVSGVNTIHVNDGEWKGFWQASTWLDSIWTAGLDRHTFVFWDNCTIVNLRVMPSCGVPDMGPVEQIVVVVPYKASGTWGGKLEAVSAMDEALQLATAW